MKDFIQGITRGPLDELLWLLALPADGLIQAILLLAIVVVACELLRIALTLELTRSAVVHVGICMLTVVVQSAILAAVLVYAAITHPGRGWINLGVALGLFVLWYLTGQLTKVVRRHNEGADVGFMTVGGLITFPAGIIAAIATG